MRVLLPQPTSIHGQLAASIVMTLAAIPSLKRPRRTFDSLCCLSSLT